MSREDEREPGRVFGHARLGGVRGAALGSAVTLLLVLAAFGIVQLSGIATGNEASVPATAAGINSPAQTGAVDDSSDGRQSLVTAQTQPSPFDEMVRLCTEHMTSMTSMVSMMRMMPDMQGMMGRGVQ